MNNKAHKLEKLPVLPDHLKNREIYTLFPKTVLISKEGKTEEQINTDVKDVEEYFVSLGWIVSQRSDGVLRVEGNEPLPNILITFKGVSEMSDCKDSTNSIYSDDNLEVTVSKPGHEYEIWNSHTEDDPIGELYFQDGPIKEVGVNGVQNEPVVAILIDRLKFLDDKFPSDYNKAAIFHLEQALESLQARTKDRVERGVEGFNVV